MWLRRVLAIVGGQELGGGSANHETKRVLEEKRNNGGPSGPKRALSDGSNALQIDLLHGMLIHLRRLDA